MYPEHPVIKKRSRPGLVILCCVIGVVITSFVYTLGWAVGSGQLRISSQQAQQNAKLPDNLNYTSVEQLYDSLKQSYDGELDATKLLDGMKAGLVEASGDPYTVFLNKEQAKEFNEQLNGTFSGIGAELGQDSQGNLIVVAPIAGFPADKAGIRPQDIIVSINDKTTVGISIPEAVTKIRGPEGTKVKLKIVRPSTKQDLSLTITREEIKIPSVKSEILDGNIGYLKINQFSDDTGELALKAAKDFKQKGVKGVILDMRGNPGGLLDQAIKVASLWLPDGKVVLQQKRGSLVTGTGMANGNNVLQDVPTAVLINEGSASASEIVAGALKDHKVAKLFGTKSFGKGSVQEIDKLPNGGELKVTIARWYRPNGQNIDKKGIEPDTKISLTEDDITNKRDPQKDAALQFLTQ